MDFKKRFYYMLAPMENMTDSCFRMLCHKYGADVTFSELARFESLAEDNKNVIAKIRLYDDTPTVMQIMGKKEEALEKFLAKFSPEKGFIGFNLNLGSPDPRSIKAGMGCAMIKRVSKVKKLLQIIKDNGYDCSIKMRLGLNSFEKEKKVYLNLINNVDADFFVVHARHGKENYKERADWSVFPECVNTSKNIIANGDIKTIEDIEKIKEIGCKGVMIGRAAIANPLIFSKLKKIKKIPIEKAKEEYLELIEERKPLPKYKNNILKHFGKEFLSLH